MVTDSLTNLSPGLPVTKSSVTYLDNVALYQVEKPFHVSGSLNEEDEALRSNLQWKVHNDIAFYDLRGFEDTLNLEENGFCFSKLVKKMPDTWDEISLQKHLLAVISVVKTNLDADIVFCYDKWFRRNNDDWKNGGEKGTYQTPGNAVNTPHTDQTEDGGIRRVLRTLKEDERVKYLDGNWRIRIVNTWNPTNATVENAPLAFCDRSSYSSCDLMACDRVTEDYVGEIYYMKYNPYHKWYWLSHQRQEEMAVFVNYDSHPGNGAKYCPHVSFNLPYWRSGAPPRESLETRMIVINRLKI